MKTAHIKSYLKSFAPHLQIAFTFILIHFALSYLATKLIPYSGIFSYPETIDNLPYPDFLKRLASFDGAHYLKIAQDGYERNSPAFFPLYPILTRLLSQLIGTSFFLSSIIITFLSFTYFLYFLNKLLQKLGLSQADKKWVQILTLTFPTSFFFIASYTESLFMMLMSMSLYFLAASKRVPLLISGFFLPLTRFVGLFLIIPIYLISLKECLTLSKKNYRLIVKNLFRKALSFNILTVVLGFITYSTFLYIYKDDALAFFNSQKDFGMGRQTDLILFPQVIYRYLKILFTADLSFQYIVALIELSVFLFVGLILILEAKNLIKRKDYVSLRAGLLLFSIINIILPTFTGTFASIPRYALSSISVFIYLSQIKSNSLKFLIAFIFAMLHIFLFMHFIQGYFVS